MIYLSSAMSNTNLKELAGQLAIKYYGSYSAQVFIASYQERDTMLQRHYKS